MRIFAVVLLILANIVGIDGLTSIPANATQSNESWLSSEYGYQLSVGPNSACVVVSDGTVRCWGSNSSGQLGNGNFSNQSKPVKVIGISNAISVSVGKVHACALLRGGTVKCWGHSAFGELGNGASGEVSKDYSSPVTVKNLTGVTQLSLGGYLSCALLATKAVKCWGAFDDSGMEESIMDTPALIDGIADATKIAAGERQVCAITLSQSVICSNRWPTAGWTPVLVRNVDNAVAIEALGSNACLLKATGSVFCWDFDGPSSAYESMPSSNISSFSMSNCMSKSDGTVWCRYLNNFGQLGNNSAPNFFTDNFVQVSGITNAISVVGAVNHTCALLASGSVKCWGANKLGQIGDGTTKNRFVPTPVSGLNQGVFQSVVTSNSIDLNWVGSLAPNGSQVSDYVIEYKKEYDSTFTPWSESQSSSRSLSIDGLDSATSYRVRISPVVNGETLDGTIYKFGTKGTAAVDFQVETSDGSPVRFGEYTWRSTDGTAKASSSREANALGFVSFGSVPAKEIVVTIKNGQLEGGGLISGTFTVISSKGSLLLTLPEVTGVVEKRIKVKLSGGQGVPNASVSSMNLATSKSVIGSNFEGSVTSPSGATGVTDSDGWVTLKGFPTDDIYVQATYDDGQLSQSTEFTQVNELDTELSLGYLPILRLSSDSFESPLNSIVEIPISVGEAGVQSASLGISSVRGVTVSVKAPSGSNQKSCGKKTVLSAKTNNSGQATLKICASLSGEYALVSSGAVSAGAVTVRVTNSKPMEVTSLSLASEANGTLTASWGSPLFDGGSPVDSYKIILKSGSVSKTLILKNSDPRFAQRTVSFSGLAVAKLWSVQVQPHNRYGDGPPKVSTSILER